MWNPSWEQINLWLHVISACIWIGGQITIGILVPLLRGQPALLAAAARRYQVIAWLAFAVLVVTGLVNVHNAGIAWTRLNATTAGRTLELKLAFVALSGAAAAVHAFVVAPRASTLHGRSASVLSATLGTVSLLAAMAAALYGVVIAEH